MKDHLKIPILLAAIFFMIATVGCSSMQDEEAVQTETGIPVKSVTPFRITGGEEILVAENIENVKPFWCGNTDILIFTKRYIGILYYDNQTKQSFQIADYGNMPIACSPDGKWLVYLNRLSLRYDIEPSTELSADLWRYEFKTGEKQKFLIATSNSMGTSLFKPDEPYTLFLGIRPKEYIEMPEPKWNLLWSRQKYSFKGFWLKDNSAIIGSYFNFDRWEKYINIEPIDMTKEIIPIDPEFTKDPKFASYVLFMFDSKDRVYLRVSDIMGDNLHIVRCKINLKDKSLSCKPVLSSFSTMDSIDVFSDGENIVFSKWEGECVKAQMIGKDNAHCITKKGLVGGTVKISPNENWLAFKKIKSIGKMGYSSDLYIIEINKTEEAE